MPQIIDIPGQGEVEFPDGMTDAQIVAAIKKLSAPKPAPEESLPKRIAGGAIEPLLTMASGMLSTPAAGIAGLATGAAQDLGLDNVPLFGALVPKESPADVVRGVQSRFTYEPQTQGGKDALSFIGAPFEVLEKGADWAGGKVTDVTGSPLTGAQTKAALSIIPALMAAKGVPKSAMPSPLKAMRSSAETLMTGALKPKTKLGLSGDGLKAVRTMLDENANVSHAGAEKLQRKTAALEAKGDDLIANSNATVDPSKVAKYLDDTRSKFGTSSIPQPHLAAIDEVAQLFADNPLLKGKKQVPARLAVDIKKGDYKVLGDSAYGELGAAREAALKDLARGWKEESGASVPGLAETTSAQSQLINAIKAIKERAAVEGNKNPIGMGVLAPSDPRMALFAMDRSARFKSWLANRLNPGKGMGITDEMALAATAPGTFSDDAKARKAIIDALLGR